MYQIIIFLNLAIVNLTSFASAGEKLTTNKWQTLDLVFKTDQSLEIPFEEVMGCVFVSETGAEINVPGFYNGNSEYVVRFTPDQTGIWHAKSYSSIETLSGITREIIVSDANDGVYGGIRIDPRNPKHFVYDSGKPYYLLAYELDWLFALDYGNAELPKTKQLLEAIKTNGFNQIVMNVYAHDVVWKKDPELKEEHEYGGILDIYPFGGTNDEPDHTTLNIDYFKHLDRVIELLNEHNIVAHVMIYVWNKKVNWPQADSKEDDRYFDYVIKRYQAYNNILWDISKEALLYGHDDMQYVTNRIDRLRRIDAYNRLVTVHDYTYCSQYPEKVDIISIQTWATNLYDQMLKIGRQFEDKPVFNIEHGGYERSPYKVFTGDYDNPEVCLRRNYLCAFAGTYSTYYWQATSWNVIIHNPLSDGVSPQPKFSYYKTMQKFLQEHGFENLRPISNKSSSGFCMTDDNGTYLYYVPGENAAIDIKNLDKSPTLKIRWFHTQKGIYSEQITRDWSGYFTLEPVFKGVDNILIISSS